MVPQGVVATLGTPTLRGRRFEGKPQEDEKLAQTSGESRVRCRRDVSHRLPRQQDGCWQEVDVGHWDPTGQQSHLENRRGALSGVQVPGLPYRALG